MSSGASLPNLAFQAWINLYERNGPGDVQLTYISEGSTAGKNNIKGSGFGPNTDFGATDAVLKASSLSLSVVRRTDRAPLPLSHRRMTTRVRGATYTCCPPSQRPWYLSTTYQRLQVYHRSCSAVPCAWASTSDRSSRGAIRPSSLSILITR